MRYAMLSWLKTVNYGYNIIFAPADVGAVPSRAPGRRLDNQRQLRPLNTVNENKSFQVRTCASSSLVPGQLLVLPARSVRGVG